MDSAFERNTLTSIDGTVIKYYTTGNGPGLELVHGTFRSAKDYEPLANYLADQFTVSVVERRGRGESGPQGKAYHFQQEVADIKAVLEITGSLFLFGQSFGGAIALEAALNSPQLSKLALYEPAVLSAENPLPVHLLPTIEDALKNGNYEDAFVRLMELLTEGEIAGAKAVEMAATLSSLTFWPEICRLLITVPAEIRALQQSGLSYPKYSLLLADTLLMSGGNSQPSAKKDLRLLAEIIPNHQIAEIANAGHNGPDTEEPLLVAETLKRWFN